MNLKEPASSQKKPGNFSIALFYFQICQYKVYSKINNQSTEENKNYISCNYLIINYLIISYLLLIYNYLTCCREQYQAMQHQPTGANDGYGGSESLSRLLERARSAFGGVSAYDLVGNGTLPIGISDQDSGVQMSLHHGEASSLVDDIAATVRPVDGLASLYDGITSCEPRHL